MGAKTRFAIENHADNVDVKARLDHRTTTNATAAETKWFAFPDLKERVPCRDTKCILKRVPRQLVSRWHHRTQYGPSSATN